MNDQERAGCAREIAADDLRCTLAQHLAAERLQALIDAADDLGRILAQRDSLLEVLKEVEPFLVALHGPSWSLAARKRVRHAIKMVEGDQQ